MNKHKRIITIAFIIIIITVIVFIWSNSIDGGIVSNAESESIADIIKPIVDSQNKISSETFNDIIRKAAHFTEFALLGTLIMLLRIALKKPPIFTMLFISLSTAVTDESIQIFNGRTDSVRDILLDFGGALTGIIISAGIYFIVLFIKKRVNNT